MEGSGWLGEVKVVFGWCWCVILASVVYIYMYVGVDFIDRCMWIKGVCVSNGNDGVFVCVFLSVNVAFVCTCYKLLFHTYRTPPLPRTHRCVRECLISQSRRCRSRSLIVCMVCLRVCVFLFMSFWGCVCFFCCDYFVCFVFVFGLEGIKWSIHTHTYIHNIKIHTHTPCCCQWRIEGKVVHTTMYVSVCSCMYVYVCV